MKRLIFLLIVIGCLSASSSSMAVPVPLDELVQVSDLIVVGTLNAVLEHSKEGTDYGEGAINIEEIIWGQAIPGESVLLKWQNPSTLGCPRVEHRSDENKSGIWLLAIEDGGVVRGGRLVDLSQRAKVERFLQEKKVSIRANKYVVSTSEPINVSVVFRNPTQSQILFPGLEHKDGYLYMSPDITIAINRGWGNKAAQVSLLASRVFVSEVVSPIIVQPGQEHRTVVDLRQLFDAVPEESYRIEVKVKGYGLSNAFGFYTSLPDQVEPIHISKEPIAAIRQNRSRLGLAMLSAIGVIGFSVSFFVYRRGRGTTGR